MNNYGNQQEHTKNLEYKKIGTNHRKCENGYKDLNKFQNKGSRTEIHKQDVTATYIFAQLLLVDRTSY